uniref:NADH dehydrogenase [ubiquinone] 1 beta subcomplex subunit 2, mitochondrial n=1 Tax=Callorhinchus milii TaxID=7868 RepID=A0A4W3ISG2_CALMI|eukprot:gi/632973719/ref/XP_007903290.1/ PREDICTED: NADH dehydrogenase [ubiquinone] 1 beta subcomplex subunit 2, mitochondrial [Callorhinchus milii]
MAALRAVGAALYRGVGALRFSGPGVGRGQAPLRRAGGDVHIESRYRQYPEVTKTQVWQSQFLSSFMWFWILWHLWHNPDAVFGHFPYPDPSKWTDEELGIPPLDEE